MKYTVKSLYAIFNCISLPADLTRYLSEEKENEWKNKGNKEQMNKRNNGYVHCIRLKMITSNTLYHPLY